MNQFSKILFVAIGTHIEAPRALRDAVALADRSDASLTVLGVLADPPLRQRDLRIADRSELITDLVAAELSARLDVWIAPFTDHHIDDLVITGSPPVEIVQNVITNGHDLLVLATDGSDESAATIRRILRLCPCAVLVLRHGHDGGRVLAAIDPDDDPELNIAILHLAQSQASMRDGELHIVHAWEAYGETILAAGTHPPILKRALVGLADQAEAAHHDALISTVAKAGISGHSEHFVNATPVQAITGLISLYRIDLLVMGSVGRIGIEGQRVGDTAEQLFPKVHCSTLVLKPPNFRSPILRS